MTNPLRIFIADDHELVRRGLRQLIEMNPDWQIAGEAANGREAVEGVRELKPDIVVLDITMPELDGLSAARQILKSLPATEILILTMHESEQIVRELLDAGARGYVLKTDAGRDLVAAVGALSRHKQFFTSTVAEMVLHGHPDAGSAEKSELALGRLSERERQILQLLAQSKSHKDIAAELGISIKTALAHRANIMHKLGLNSLSDLVRFAIRANVIPG